MLLIFDSDTDADIREINMAVINSENMNEKFSSDRLLDKFNQNDCVENSQDVKKLADAEISTKDIENSSYTEIDDSIMNNDTKETVSQDQTVEKKNKEDSEIDTCELDNQETKSLNTPYNESDKNSVLKDKLPSQITEKVKTKSKEKDILPAPISELSNTIEPAKDDIINDEDSSTPLENDSLEKMDVDEDQESISDITKSSIEVSSVVQRGDNIENLNLSVELTKEDKAMNERKDLGKESIDNPVLLHSVAATSLNRINDCVKHDAMNINNNVDSIVESSDIKVDNLAKEEVLKCETLPMDVCDKSIKTDMAKGKTHIDTNTIEINDDSSQDDIVQKETSVKNSLTLCPTNEDNQEVSKSKENVTLPSKKNMKEENSAVSSVKELSNLNEKDEVSISNKDSNNLIDEPKMEDDKSLDSDVQSRSCIEQKKEVSPKSKLSNSLNILSDDEDNNESIENNHQGTNKQCINLDEDDDILLIDDEDTSNGEKKNPSKDLHIPAKDVKEILENNQVHAEEKFEKQPNDAQDINESVVKDENITAECDTEKVKNETEIPSPPSSKPLLPSNFLSMCKKNVSEMTRNDLEEFCIMKIVESVVDRGNIGEMKSQLKKLAFSLDEHRNKIKSITKQNQDLQVILRSVQEACRKNSLVTPLKITRSVGIQVVMTEKSKQKATAPSPNNAATPSPAKPVRSPSLQNKPKPTTTSQNIPVPRLVPAKSSPSNVIQNQTPNNKVPINQQSTPVKPAAPRPEKRPFSKSQSGSDTVDLTDDEPPNKVVTRAGNQSVRVISPQNLMPPQRVQMVNSPRKVYIPIGGGQVSNIRPTQQAYMLKPANNQNVRQRVPGMRRVHPAPLPESGKQYQAPSWKAVPPAPEIKLSKVENGIVISWKLDSYREDVHENIASYQIYAYQETPSPPSTNLWKKIGDVKALPLPMACTLTQFVPGFKYYFAVRAVDVRSRQGSFSNPGNIMLLNK